jgi:parallel beta-helix repeat protein
VPAAGDLYSIFRWTFSNATISGNTLIDNPNGIVIYDGCYNCTVQNNTLTNSRQIVVRVADQNINASSLYPEGRRAHQVALNVNISNNTVSDTSGIRPAYIALDVEAFASDHYRGIGIMNVQVGENTVNPYTPNPSQTYLPGSSEITQEGFFPCFFYGPAPVKDPITTVFQGVSVGNNVLGSAVKYGSGFLPYTTSVCTSPPGSSPVNSPTSVQPVAR